ncbi:hypothetical protein B0A52_00885 [Exophiala mesophila]|uniref:Choline transport protein n=1 Tax=Exophiala mesophila TaxID=212818 RepID=A0A438NIG9_EXOME|nr:hypothetical protein B0A52_00885 [Exophiala mesophila]
MAVEEPSASQLQSSTSDSKNSVESGVSAAQEDGSWDSIGPCQSLGMKRDLSVYGILSAGYSISNSWLVVAANLAISLFYGPMNTVWGLILTTVIYSCVGLTLCELVSAYPTTGGQYHWTSILAPKGVNRAASYFCGFISWLSWLMMCASSMGAVANSINALALNANPDFVMKPWLFFVIYEAMNIIALLFNLFFHKGLGKLYEFGFVLSLVSFVVITVTCLAMQHDKQTSSYVWFATESGSGWSLGTQFMIGLAGPVIAFMPLDGAAHLVAEVNRPAIIVPKTIMASLVISFLSALVFVLAVLYSISDVMSVLTSPSGFILFELWRQATGSTAPAIAFTISIIIMLPIGSVACQQVASMMALSLGLDKALVFPDTWGTLNKRLNTPVNALLLNFALMFLVGILFLVSTLAYNALIGTAIVLQQITLVTPTAFLLYNRRSALALPPARPFKLPNLVGWTVNIVTVVALSVTTAFFFLPASRPVTAHTMNYACVVVAGFLTIGVINWFIHARKHYHGPRSFVLHQ